jgi:outer membrane receptor protein involved in Fe transport
VKKSSKLFYENVANPFGDAGATLDRTILYYNQRTLTNLFFKHEFEKDSAWKFITKLSPSISTNNEPDMKITALSVGEDGYKFNVGAGSEIKRLYRNLSEKNINSKFDAERKIFIGNSKVSKLKFGMAHNYKHRDFAVLQYVFQPIGSFNLNGDPNQIFDEYLYNAESDRGYAVFGEPIKSNEFVSSMNVMGLYAMNELPIGARTTAIYGFRVEKSDMFYTGENTNNESYLNYKVLDEMNILPSASFIYRATSGINVRIAASQTIARPSFKEKSLAQIYDPISGRTFIGNLDLEQTEITNLDLRFEKFMKRGELISVSGFYKHFNNPIEIVVYKPETPTNFTPRNAVSADIYGAELEIRKSLSFLSDKLSLASNFSYILSQVEMTPNERIGKTNELRKGQTLDDKREMQGQAPYIINFGINYDNRESGFTANLSYNVQGPKLSIVGIGRLPDVYTESFHSLNFKSSYSLGKGKRSQISFAVTNLLNDIPVQVYRGLNAEDKIFTQRLVQRTFKIGYSLKIK